MTSSRRHTAHTLVVKDPHASVAAEKEILKGIDSDALFRGVDGPLMGPNGSGKRHPLPMR